VKVLKKIFGIVTVLLFVLGVSITASAEISPGKPTNDPIIITPAPTGITPAPVATATPAPDVTDAPVVTNPPDATDAPVVTTPPDVTDAPVVTTPPDVTDAPVVTTPPDVTDAPVVTNPPDITNPPSAETDEPVIETEAPGEETFAPIEVTNPPSSPSQAPSDEEVHIEVPFDPEDIEEGNVLRIPVEGVTPGSVVKVRYYFEDGSYIELEAIAGDGYIDIYFDEAALAAFNNMSGNGSLSIDYTVEKKEAPITGDSANYSGILMFLSAFAALALVISVRKVRLARQK